MTGGGANDAEKLSVFISYSRDDLAFADQLEVALSLGGFDTRLDRHGIHGAENWQDQLGRLIREADTVVFVLSPSSAQSEMCAWEVQQAVEHGKRIIPALCHPLGSVPVPSALASLQYIFFYEDPKRPGASYRSGMSELVAALKTDLAWMRDHTRYLQRALEWDGGGRTDNRLLSGQDIQQAKSWLARQPKDAPAPTSLHLDFIKRSEAWEAEQTSERERQLEERERLVRQAEADRSAREAAQQEALAAGRRVVRYIGIAAVVAIALACGAGWQWLVAQSNAEKAQKSATLAEAYAKRADDILDVGRTIEDRRLVGLQLRVRGTVKAGPSAPGRRIFYGGPVSYGRSAASVLSEYGSSEHKKVGVCTGVVISTSAVLTTGGCGCGSSHRVHFGEAVDRPDAVVPAATVHHFPGYDCSRPFATQPGEDFSVLTFDPTKVPAEYVFPVEGALADGLATTQSLTLHVVGYGVAESRTTAFLLGSELPMISPFCSEDWARDLGCMEAKEFLLSDLKYSAFINLRTSGAALRQPTGTAAAPILVRQLSLLLLNTKRASQSPAHSSQVLLCVA
jgi:hypothetical protein